MNKNDQITTPKLCQDCEEKFNELIDRTDLAFHSKVFHCGHNNVVSTYMNDTIKTFSTE